MAHLTLQQAVRDAILSARHDPLDVLLGFRDPLLSAGSHRLVQAGRLLVVAVFCGGVVAVGNGLLARQKRTGDKDEATAAGSGTGRTRPPTCRHQKSNLRPSGEVLGFFGESSRVWTQIDAQQRTQTPLAHLFRDVLLEQLPDGDEDGQRLSFHAESVHWAREVTTFYLTEDPSGGGLSSGTWGPECLSASGSDIHASSSDARAIVVNAQMGHVDTAQAGPVPGQDGPLDFVQKHRAEFQHLLPPLPVPEARFPSRRQDQQDMAVTTSWQRRRQRSGKGEEEIFDWRVKKFAEGAALRDFPAFPAPIEEEDFPSGRRGQKQVGSAPCNWKECRQRNSMGDHIDDMPKFEEMHRHRISSTSTDEFLDQREARQARLRATRHSMQPRLHSASSADVTLNTDDDDQFSEYASASEYEEDSDDGDGTHVSAASTRRRSANVDGPNLQFSVRSPQPGAQTGQCEKSEIASARQESRSVTSPDMWREASVDSLASESSSHVQASSGFLDDAPGSICETAQAGMKGGGIRDAWQEPAKNPQIRIDLHGPYTLQPNPSDDDDYELLFL